MSKASANDPPFTIKELEAAIPAHCFKRDNVTSLTYLAVDLSLAIFTFYLATWIPSFSWYMQLLLWPTYWIVQGFTGTGLVGVVVGDERASR
jgi:fatty acid desaturase